MKDNKDLEKTESVEKTETTGSRDSKKVEKAAPKKKSFMESLRKIGRSLAKWGRDLRGEAKKIVWPGWKQTRNNTVVVLSVIAIVSVVIWLVDLFFENIILKGLLALVTGF